MEPKGKELFSKGEVKNTFLLCGPQGDDIFCGSPRSLRQTCEKHFLSVPAVVPNFDAYPVSSLTSGADLPLKLNWSESKGTKSRNSERAEQHADPFTMAAGGGGGGH